MSDYQEAIKDGKKYFSMNGGVFEDRGHGHQIFIDLISDKTLDEFLADYKEKIVIAEPKIMSSEECLKKVKSGEMSAQQAAEIYKDERYEYGMRYYEPEPEYSREWMAIQKIWLENFAPKEAPKPIYQPFKPTQRCKECREWLDQTNYTTLIGSGVCDDCL